MPNKDKVKAREYHRKWYARNAKTQVERVKRNRQRIQKWLADYKVNLACIICGENHPACLEFHHRDPLTKDINIGEASNRGWSIKRIEQEVSKCDVLCSNCHRKLHATLI